MPQRIFFDGLNLDLARGTGIATYTRVLMQVAHDLGYETGVLYGPRKNPVRDPLLREINFFDQEQEIITPARQPILHFAADYLGCGIDQFRYAWPVRPVPISLTGVVAAQRFDSAPPAQDRVFAVRSLFDHAQVYFAWRGRFVDLSFDEAPEIFHCTYPLPLRARRARNLYTIHDLVPLRLPFATLDKKRRILRLLRKIAREADHIVTVSENSKRDIVDLLGIPETKISNTYQSTDFPQEYIDRPQSSVANFLDGVLGLEFHGYLLFYGALEPKKNVGRLIEAYLASGVGVPLVLVVGGGWQNRTESRLLAGQAARQPARGERGIRRLEYVGLSTLVNLIRGARALVFPSLYEGFGLPVLEAMTLGTPVVTSRVSALPEIAGDAAQLVDPYDTDQLARAMTRIVNDADLRTELSRRGQAQAAKFSRERYRERVAALYMKLG